MLAVALAGCALLGLRTLPILWLPLILAGPEGFAALIAWYLPAKHMARRFARVAIAVLVVSNLKLIAQSIYFPSSYLWLLRDSSVCISLALIAIALLAWKSSAWRKPGGSGELSLRAMICVGVLGFMLLSVLIYDWPMKLAFKLSEPALESLANRIEREAKVTQPTLAGAFLIVASAVEASSGNVALITIDSSSGRTGLVRVGLNSTQETGPLYNHNMNVELAPRWRLQEED